MSTARVSVVKERQIVNDFVAHAPRFHHVALPRAVAAARILRPALRTHMLHARIPRYQVAMLQHVAQQESTTVSAVLTRELEDMASAYADELSRSIPGFAAALAWPFGENADQVC